VFESASRPAGGVAFRADTAYNPDMTKLLIPHDENELMLITSLLEGNGIDFLVQNEYFGGLYPGLNIFPFNERVILVAEADFDRASLLARDFLESIEGKPRQEGQVG
jgi:Putative prokaryotic signal transducing protein